MHTRKNWTPPPSHRATLAGLAAVAAAISLSSFTQAALADSHDQERQIGQQVYTDLRNKNQIVDQSPYYPVLRAVGKRISDAAAPHWYPLNFIIVKGNQANAFSVPGGNIYVNEALLHTAANQDELAGVLGHETGHLELGHVMDRLRKAQQYNLIGGILGIFVHSQMQATLLNFLANYSFLNFNRAQEYQADHEGAILASRAGYNPWGEIWFFRKLDKLYGNAGFEQYVQDHPSGTDRIARLQSFFQSNPSQFSRWHDLMPSGKGLATSGSNTHLVLTQ
ncbi:MAG: M48 family metalloprotease [Candidatus Eremiobacteraeota bacterium]|nr:M48 family metalloprotease [Candidatus Eremiobacteraeota bacterium]MBC5826913.1 M48 family metalloprotease [Candidatus Eremiobacteraeota bacterium]